MLTAHEKTIYQFLKNKKFTNIAIAGIMGNLFAESNIIPNNAQDSFNKSSGLSDIEYTNRVDSGTYSNFIYDAVGYGIAQWTSSDRKQKLYNLCKANNKSISDLDC